MKEFFRTHWKVLSLVVVGIVVLAYMNKDGDQMFPAPEMGGYYEGDAAQSYAPEMLSRGMAAKSYEEQAYTDEMTSSFIPPVPVTDQGIDAVDRMIIRSGNITVKVDDPEKTFEEVKTYVTSVKGFIENANVSEVYDPQPIPYYEYGDTRSMTPVEQSDSEKQKQVSATVRIPEEHYDAALAKFRAFGYVSSESLNGQDVTASFQDNKARLENLKAREAKVREFYARAKDVEETLKVFAQLEQLRFEIEQLESQQKSLERQTSYSTIWLNLMPNTEVKPFTSGEWNLGEVWNKTVNKLKLMLRDLAELGITAVVYAVIWVPALLILWIIVRFAKKKKAQM